MIPSNSKKTRVKKNIEGEIRLFNYTTAQQLSAILKILDNLHPGFNHDDFLVVTQKDNRIVINFYLDGVSSETHVERYVSQMLNNYRDNVYDIQISVSQHDDNYSRVVEYKYYSQNHDELMYVLNEYSYGKVSEDAIF